MKKALAIAIACGLMCSARLSNAQEQAGDPDQLFTEATQLINEEKFAEAIPKLEEAQRRDPGIGTLFNLAVCYAKVGKLAIAWRSFNQVEALARAAGKKQREAAARAQLDELAPRVSHITLRVDDITVSAVRVDGEPVSAADYAFVAVDPGEHVVEAVAAAKKPFSATVNVAGEGELHAIVVPVLDPIETKTEVVTVADEGPNTRRTLGFVFGGIGLAGLAAATVTGIMLLDDKSTADERCKPSCVTSTGEIDQEGVDAVQRGKTLLPINAIAWGVGIVGLGAGAFFVLTSGKKTPPKTAIIPYVDSRGAYSVLTHSF